MLLANLVVTVALSLSGGTLDVGGEPFKFVQFGVHTDPSVVVTGFSVPGFSFVSSNCTSCDNGDPRTVWLFSTALTAPVTSLSWTWTLSGDGAVVLFRDFLWNGCAGNPVNQVQLATGALLDVCGGYDGPLGQLAGFVDYGVQPELLVVGDLPSDVPDRSEWATWTAIKGLYR